MRTIYKYPLEITDEQTLELPGNAEPLSVQVQNGVLCLWAIVQPKAITKYELKVWIHGTGNPSVPIGNPGKFLGTVQMAGFVWHVFVDL